MASHFEDFCKLQTFEPHRPSSFFEVLYPVSTGNFLRHACHLRCLRLSFCLGMVSLALPVDLPMLLLVSECRARVVFFATCSSFFASFVVDLDSLVAGDLRHEFT